MFDEWESILAVVVAILIAYGAVLWLGIIVWTYRDIRERTRDTASQVMAALLVVLFNIPGLFLYLILRPTETLTEAYERRLEGEALIRELAEHRRSCPSCQAPVREDFLLCPQCRTKLQEPCSDCGRALELSWAACPYCGAQGPQPAMPDTAAETMSDGRTEESGRPAAAEALEPSASSTTASATSPPPSPAGQAGHSPQTGPSS
jgi:RNA polymerase subunit RPABC4/transcription elongation factor Spt4